MARTSRAAAAAQVQKGVAVPPVVLAHPSTVNPAPYNPRTITPEKLEGLKANIREAGFVENLVIQKLSPKYGPNIVVSGHQRLRGLREICIEDNVEMPPVPMIFLDLTDREAKRLNAAMNAPRGENDVKLLGEMLEDIQHERPITAVEASAMGIAQDELAKLLKLSQPPTMPNTSEGSSFGRSVTLSLAFNDVRQRDAVKEKLAELAEAQKKTPGEIVFALLNRKR